MIGKEKRRKEEKVQEELLEVLQGGFKCEELKETGRKGR